VTRIRLSFFYKHLHP